MTDVRLTALNPETSEVVPVACNSRGELLIDEATDYLPLTGGNLTSDLTIGPADGSPVIRLASNGSASFVSEAITFQVNGDADFGGSVHVDSGELSAAYCNLNFQDGRTGPVFQVHEGLDVDNPFAPRFAISHTGDLTSRGTASFLKDVIVGSRNKQWMIVESNGLAHLVDQTDATAATADLVDEKTYPPLRDIPGELTMVEQQLQKVMERLKMAPEAGWDVWDGDEQPAS